MIFTPEQARAYFAYRLPNERIPAGGSVVVRCGNHPDRTASLSINFDKGGIWKCHAGCGEGGILDHERLMFPGGDLDSWWGAITKITGIEPKRKAGRDLGKLVATYDYTDPAGILVFQKLRYEPKNFIQRAPNGKGGFNYSLNGVSKPLYQLPRVICSQVAMICEGEKDADALNEIDWNLLAEGKKAETVSATCNFDGAGPGKWKDSYSSHFSGRRVIIFPDNDTVGKEHAAQVALSVSKYAYSVRVVELPGLAEHGDVSDYLKDHTPADLFEVIKNTPPWRAPQEDAKEVKPFFVAPSEIMRGQSAVEWLIPGIIHRGGKGLIVAAPKAGKSMIALDLAVALAARQCWLGKPCISRQVRTAVISREDGPGMTKRRVEQFVNGRDLNMRSLDGWLWFNTHEQKSSFSIESDADVEEVVTRIKQESIEFCIFDVLNILHSADENSNTAMTQVMKRFDYIRQQTGVDLAIIHHDKKDSTTGNKKPRGASAIDSWWEWKISISPEQENEEVKEVYFGSKAGMAHPAMTIEFRSEGDSMLIVPAISKNKRSAA